jgi:uroporphyrinogen III methyltransferase/synthase
VIEWGTLPEQRVVEGALSEIDKRAEEAGIGPPAVLVVGETVGLRGRLAWFEKKALFGKRIVVTRPQGQDEEMTRLLEREGARVLHLPTIMIEPIEPNEDLERALREISSFFGIVLTSVNAAGLFLEALLRSDVDIRELFGLRIFCIGPRTAREVRKYGIHPEELPRSFTQEGIVALLQRFDLRGKKVLLPRAEIAGRTVEAYIRRMGGLPYVVPLYRTVMPKERQPIPSGIDVVSFTSSSTVRNFVALYGKGAFEGARVASIGPSTTEALRRLGIEVHIEAERHDALGLVEAIKGYFARG